MMELLSGFPKDVVALVWHDRIARDIDPDAPASERDASARDHDIRVLAKLHWDDEHRPEFAESSRGQGQWRDFDRIAIVTDEASVRHTVQFFAPFLHPATRVFPNREGRAAREWLSRRELS
jgi:hypothetical protein